LVYTTVSKMLMPCWTGLKIVSTSWI